LPLFAGRIETGAKGLACIPAAEADFQKSIQTAIDYAKALRCTK
jgi:hydroxypyruvate isomerase